MSSCVLEVKLGVNKGQVPNFSAPLWRGLFEICKDLNPCPGIRVVYGMSLGVFALAYCPFNKSNNNNDVYFHKDRPLYDP